MSEHGIHKARGIVRQLTMGNDYKEAMKYVVGKTYNEQFTITSITENEYDSLYFGNRSYDVFVKDLIVKNEFLWASTNGVHCVVQYENPEKKTI